jgi:leucyl/phenylalanyl-tRNA--protein transferase
VSTPTVIEGAEAWDRRPVEPPPSPWGFPRPAEYGTEDLVAIGGDLEPGTILRAYRQGLFPMHADHRHLGWWSPVERGIIPLDTFRPSRSLRRSCRRYGVSVDRDFAGVIAACAGADRPHGWITPSIIDAYNRLHELGWAHSVEAWTEHGELAGGLYGLRLGGLFAGESMVHLFRDGSKVALVALVELLRASGATLLDVQWLTPHLATLGAIAVRRQEYLTRLADALRDTDSRDTTGKPMG